MTALNDRERRLLTPYAELVLERAQTVRSGFALLSEGLALVATAPLSGGSSLVTVRYLSRVTEANRDALEPVAAVGALPVAKLKGLARDQSATQITVSGRTLYVRPEDGSTVKGYATLQDLSGEPVALLVTTTPRRLVRQGVLNARLLVTTTVLVDLTFGALALLLVERLMLSRLGFLSHQVGRIARSSSLSERIELVGADELARLARDINGMLGSLFTETLTLLVSLTAAVVSVSP